MDETAKVMENKKYQPLTEILAYTCKYVQIDQVVFACMSMYTHLFGSICMYLSHQVARVVGKLLYRQY